MAAKQAVVVLGEIKFAQSALKKLESVASVTKHIPSTKEAFLETCASVKPIAIYRPLDTSQTVGRFDSSLLDSLPSSVKYVAHNGAGYDQVDVEHARTRGITVSNTPGVVNEATADTAMWLILGALRKFAAPARSCAAGKWREGLDVSADGMGRDPQGKVVGIVGMGGIGRVLARRAAAFDMRVQYHNRRQLPADQEAGTAYVDSLDKLLATSDVISLNLPLNKHTRHYISHDQLAKMKDGAVLINTARGPVVDEAALVQALESGKLAGAGLDVFEEEPKIHQGLLNSDKVIMLPHIGTVSQETQRALEELTLENIVVAIQTGKLKTPVPEHAH
ncbi:hypothetical protein PYCC9005_005719 [Savitreella phatthalungensis]